MGWIDPPEPFPDPIQAQNNWFINLKASAREYLIRMLTNLASGQVWDLVIPTVKRQSDGMLLIASAVLRHPSTGMRREITVPIFYNTLAQKFETPERFYLDRQGFRLNSKQLGRIFMEFPEPQTINLFLGTTPEIFDQQERIMRGKPYGR